MHYSTSFFTSGYLSPNLNGLFMTRGKDDIVSKRQFILGSQTEMVSLFSWSWSNTLSKCFIHWADITIWWHYVPPHLPFMKKKSLFSLLCSTQQWTKSYWEHAASWDSWKRYYLIGFFRDTSLCRHRFYVGGCCFCKATRSFPICCKSKINRALLLTADKSMGRRLVTYNITPSYSVMFGPFLILIFSAACNTQLYNLTQASCYDANAVTALIIIQLGEVSHYWYTMYSASLSQGK